MPSADVALSPSTVASSGLCIGCGACAVARPGLAMQFDRYGLLKPHGPDAPQASEHLARICPFSPAAANEDEIAALRFGQASYVHDRIGRYEAAFVGSVREGSFREAGSSGGLTTWLACELLRLGLVDGVAHVGPGRVERGEPLFGYRLSRSEAEVRARAKSRYYPVEMSDVITKIRETPGRYAFVGIPCFIKAVNLLRASDELLAERIVYTLGLFCGHMKSARMAESFALQLGTTLNDVAEFDFRRKDATRPANWYRTEAIGRDGHVRARDWWDLADGDWGAGFFQSPACDYCDDVVAETADISFGDAWLEPYQRDGRGTNVVIVRSAQLHRIVKDAHAQNRIELDQVDAGFVVRTQAAGFRQRRDGLAFRLSRRRQGITPIKRVPARATGLPVRRRAIFLMRQQISRWSHRVFFLARALGLPVIYTAWARTTLRAYQALAHSRGKLGAVIDRWTGTEPRTPD